MVKLSLSRTLCLHCCLFLLFDMSQLSTKPLKLTEKFLASLHLSLKPLLLLLFRGLQMLDLALHIINPS